jgi:hypothetical protein
LNTDVKALLQEAESDLVGMYIISADMSGFTSLAEAQTMLNVLHDRAEKAINLLKEDRARKFVQGA